MPASELVSGDSESTLLVSLDGVVFELESEQADAFGQWLRKTRKRRQKQT